MADENEGVVTDGSADLQLDSQVLIDAIEQDSANNADDAGDVVDQAADMAAVGAEDKTGQEKDVITPNDDKGQKKVADPPDSEKEDGEKPPPYDKDPKWLEARAAQKSLNELLEETGHESIAELVEDLKSGKDLQETLGDADIEAIIEDAQTLEKYNKIWAQQDIEKQREEESPEDTIDRLEREKQELIDTQTQEKTTKESQEEAQANLDNFDAEINKAVENIEDMGEDKQALTKLLLGLENPVITVDITDKKAVREMAAGQIAKVNELFGKIEQTAIDAYAAGKKTVSKTGKPPEAEAAVTKEKTFKLADDAVVNDTNIEDYFATGAGELHEILQGLIQEE